MSTITTQAWVLKAGDTPNPRKTKPGTLHLETFQFPDINKDEVLAEPIYGCWEGNMGHAIERKPVDICHQRKEAKTVIGNAGVVRIKQVGTAVTTVKPGDYAILFCNGIWDESGYTVKVLGYDAPGTMGVLAKTMKMHQKQVIPVPKNSKYSLKQWAAFSLRYITAWANWQVAYRCWRTQMPDIAPEDMYVFAWGGGVSLGELVLAKEAGCQTFMFASNKSRLKLIEDHGITAIDRRIFGHLSFDPDRYETDEEFRNAYKIAEKLFLKKVNELTNGRGVSIFIDNIGGPVARATTKALGRQGVVTTTGWKCGMDVRIVRAVECIQRHIHVHTHYASYAEGVDAVEYAEKHGWLPPVDGSAYAWENMLDLISHYSNNVLDTYFPIFSVNPDISTLPMSS